MSQLKRRSVFVTSILVAGVIALSMASCFCLVGLEPMVILSVFNFLFVSFAFRLNGTLRRKLALLALGNIVGLSWNYFLALVVCFGCFHFGDLFVFILRVFSPFLNSTWVVSYWSLSLSALPKPELKCSEGLT